MRVSDSALTVPPDTSTEPLAVAWNVAGVGPRVIADSAFGSLERLFKYLQVSCVNVPSSRIGLAIGLGIPACVLLAVAMYELPR